MISRLHIENIAVIKDMDINFENGLNIITGETGSGKSIIIDAINIILGGRISKSIVRSGCNYMMVSGLFNDINENIKNLLESLGFKSDGGSVLIHREFRVTGKNVCKINGRPATLQILKEIGNKLVNIYGQHDNYDLLSISNHVKYIDGFGGLGPELIEYKGLYNNLCISRSKLKSMLEDESDKERQLDLLNYQIQELEEANVTIGEKKELTALKNMYSNSEKIINLIESAKKELNGSYQESGAVQKTENASSYLNEVSMYFKGIVDIAQRLNGLYYELQECVSDLDDMCKEMEYNPEEMEKVESRLDLLYKLSRKYGNTEEDIILFLENAKSEYNNIQSIDKMISKTKKEVEFLEKRAEEFAKDISKKRSKSAENFISCIKAELKSLDMPDINIGLKHEICELSSNGCDSMEILISANKGEELKSISKTASGGELSRMMLAIKNTVSDVSDAGTFIFDEIDTGVSGSAANKIGIKLKELSSAKQIICITHLAQIAALADEHLLIKKETDQSETFTYVNSLNFNDRKKELARIIGGISVSDTTLKTAEEMLTQNMVQ